MTESLKPRRKKTHIMTTLPAHSARSVTKCVTVLTPFLKHLNTGTLAIFLFVALASLTSHPQDDRKNYRQVNVQPYHT